MKPASVTHILAGLSFLIFFCPFFQTCSVTVPNFSGKPSPEKTQQQIRAEEQSRTYSGYRLAGLNHAATDTYSNATVHFDIILLLSVAIAYFSIRGNYANVFWFSLINLVLLLMALMVLVAAFPFLTMRYGFYLLLCNTGALIIFSRRAYKESEFYIFQKPAI